MKTESTLMTWMTTGFVILISSLVSSARAQGTAFTYQGQLYSSGSLANGSYDLKLTLFDAVTNGNTIAGPVTNTAIAVSNGLFTTTIDFGGAFDGNPYWLRLQVRTNGGGAFTTLSPRQQLTPTPYAEFATTASNLSGAISFAQLPAGLVTNNESALTLTGSFSGNGAGLTYVNASALNGVPAGNFWQLGGNNVGGGQFIGSTNNQPIEIWVAGQRALRLEPDTTGSGSPNVIGGSIGNFMNAGGVIGGFIGGGGATNYNGVSYPNHVAAYYGSVVGGYANTIVAFANTGFIGGGDNNTVAGNSAAIGGGEYNRIKSAADHGVIAGGISNTNSGEFGVIGGGQFNSATAISAVVAGGNANTASAQYSAVAGGSQNNASGGSSAVGGGNLNTAGGASATVGGGAGNSAGGTSATVGGGTLNSANGIYSTVGGGNFNSSTLDYATVAGGQNNSAVGIYGTVGGGEANTATNFSTVAGGVQNGAYDFYSAVGGGYHNFIDVGGYEAFIGGGEGNHASGSDAVVPGGYYNSASGPDSFAAGAFAQANNANSFVWSDGNGVQDTGPGQFLIQARGGVGVNTNNPHGDALSIGGTTRLNDNTIYLRGFPDTKHGLGYVGNGTSIYGASPDGPVLFGYAGGALVSSESSYIALQWTTTSVTVNGTFNNNSDRNAKEKFATVSAAQILEKVSRLPVSEWSYKTDAATRHIGPMAQDFYAAFNVGTDEKHIAPIDEGGVALAAIQGLNRKLAEELSRRDAENAELKQRLEKLEQLMTEKLGGAK